MEAVKTLDEIPKVKTPEIPERQFIMFYFQNGSMRPNEAVFKFKGTLREAVTEAKRHCIVMGWRHMFTRPHIVDFALQEKMKMENPNWTEDSESSDDLKIRLIREGKLDHPLLKEK